MKIRLILVLSCAFLLHNYSFAQQAEKQQYIDSLLQLAKELPEDTTKIKVYTRLYEKLMYRDPELSFVYAKKEYELSKKLDFKRGVASSYLHFADYYKDRGSLDSARFYFNKSMKAFQNINNTRGILFVNHSIAAFEQSLGNYEKALEYAYANIDLYENQKAIASGIGNFNLIGSEYHLIGGIHIELGNYNIALNETLKSLEFFEETKDTIRAGDALMQLGDIEYALENYAESLEYNKQAYTIYEDYEDLQYQAYAANSIGKAYRSQKKYSDAKIEFEKALSLAERINNSEIQGNTYINLGTISLAQKELSAARSFFNKGLAIHQNLNYKKSIVEDLNALTRVELADRKYTLALDYAANAIIRSEEINAKKELSEAFLLRSKSYEGLQNSTLALQDYKNHKRVTDDLFNRTTSQQIQELRTIHETDKKNQEIAIQKNEIALLEEKEKAASLSKTLLIFGLGALLIIFGLVYYALRQKIKQNTLVRENLNKDLEIKNKELTSYALHLVQKNEVLESLKQKVQELKSKSTNQGCQQIIQAINFNLKDDNNWENFTRYFEKVHSGFSKTIRDKFPSITTNELRLMALLRMNMSSKEIASILNISVEGVKKARYRLRKKMELDTNESLQDTVLQL